MATASAQHTGQPPLPAAGKVLQSPTPTCRAPLPMDYALFFVAIPLVLAFIFSMVGTRLTNGMPYLDSLAYMSLHMFTAWWPVCLGGFFIKFCFRSWEPPIIAVCLIGLLVALMPTAYLFQKLGDIYAQMYPIFAINRTDDILPSWDFDYFLHFVRYSMPILPTFLAGVYGYRFATGVDWFGYSDPYEQAVAQTTDATEVAPKLPATASMIEGCKLPGNSEILAIKAEQHYIHIWTDQGNELVRYRFSDIAANLSECKGTQVHRSWWINLDKVKSYKQNGRKMELLINDELQVPVSLSYKNMVLNVLES
jgi:hypothetical protein